jgi:hypothetical protein
MHLWWNRSSGETHWVRFCASLQDPRLDAGSNRHWRLSAFEQEATGVSTAAAALSGARRYAEEHGIDPRTCYDVKGAVRMTEKDGVTVRVMAGRTPLGRRLAMVAGVHVVVTVSGKQHTEVVVEQALELGFPTLPIPDAGGDSKDLLMKHRERIAASFDPGALDKCLADVSGPMRHHPEAAARSVVDLIRTAKIGKCLVLLPYDDVHNELFTSMIQPAIAKHMIPVLDRLPTSEASYTSFADTIRSCSAVIADITLLNENVMYEVGFATAWD